MTNWRFVFTDRSYFEAFQLPSPLLHTWSLAVEEQFYVIWPLVVGGVLWWWRRSVRVLTVITTALVFASAALMAILYSPGREPVRAFYGTDTRAQAILVGAVLALLLARPGHRARAPRLVTDGAAVLAVLGTATIWLLATDRSAWLYHGGFLVHAVLVAVVIAVVASPRPGPVGAVLSLPVLAALGRISYGVYLWHWPVFVFLHSELAGLDGWALVGLRVGVTLALATASFVLVEQPILRGRLRARRYVISLAGAALVVGVAVVGLTIGASSTRDVAAAAKSRPPDIVQADARMVPAVMLVGDSMADSLAPGLAKATSGGMRFWNASVPGCGLATDVGERWRGAWDVPVEECAPGWRTRWPGQVRDFDPDVVLLLLGTQDAFDRRIGDDEYPFDASGGRDLAVGELTGAIDVLGSSGARVVVLTTPYMNLGAFDATPEAIERSPFNPAWIDRWNDYTRAAVARAHVDATVADLNPFLAPGGRWTESIDGTVVRLPFPDLNHLSPAGADLVAEWLLPTLRSATQE